MRGGRIFILLGIIVAALVAVLFFAFFQPQATPETVTAPATQVPERDVVAALVDIPANTVLTDTETFLTTTKVSELQYNADPTRYFTNFAELQSKITTISISANSPITKDMVREGGLSLLMPTAVADQPSRKAIPFQVNNLTGVADLLQPGDFVDLIVTFKFERNYLRPSIQYNQENNTYSVIFNDDKFTDGSAKTLAQNIQVLKISKPQAATDGTPTPSSDGEPPQTAEDGSVVGADGSTQPAGDTLIPGSWVVVLAVTDQEAEIIRYSLQQASSMALVLRGRGDTTVEQTLGVTLNILVSQYGLPEPQPFLPPPAPITDLTPTPGP